MQPQPQLIDHIADMSAEDLRIHLRNAYGTTSALNREIEMLHGMIRRQKEQRDALLAACKDLIANHEAAFAGREKMMAQYYASHPWREQAYDKARAAIRQTESPGTITVYDIPACNVCGQGFTAAEWDDKCEGHEEGCPRRDDPDGDEPCDCNLLYHARCCPDCRD